MWYPSLQCVQRSRCFLSSLLQHTPQSFQGVKGLPTCPGMIRRSQQAVFQTPIRYKQRMSAHWLLLRFWHAVDLLALGFQTLARTAPGRPAA